MTRNKNQVWPVFLAFLAMGFGDAVGPFVGLAKEHFRLSNLLAQCIPLVGFAMFGLLSAPMGVWQDRRGKKFVLILGLAIMLTGILIPSIMGLSTFRVFLITIMLLGAGATTLQVAGNPIMRRRLTRGKVCAQPLAWTIREGYWVALRPPGAGGSDAVVRREVRGDFPGVQRGGAAGITRSTFTAVGRGATSRCRHTRLVAGVTQE